MCTHISLYIAPILKPLTNQRDLKVTDDVTYLIDTRFSKHFNRKFNTTFCMLELTVYSTCEPKAVTWLVGEANRNLIEIQKVSGF